MTKHDSKTVKIFKRFTGDLILEVEGVNLKYADLRYAYLEGANLRGANLIDSNLVGADLRGADLIGSNLVGSNLVGADLRGADLIGSNLVGSNLKGANLIGANLEHADLRGANLKGANLEHVDLWGCAGDRDYIRSIFISEVYPITYTSEVMQIGCENHALKDWFKFDDRRILQMDGKTALKFWREHKELIKQIIEKCPAKPTKGGE